jgi:hypothetical protein
VQPPKHPTVTQSGQWEEVGLMIGAPVRPSQELDWRKRGAVTSFDWNAKETNLLATAHFNGTMYLWDINVSTSPALRGRAI